ncbi:MAG: DNA polymerase III subunit gamma/tau [Candidatus Aureabacteria bacterium]|nr:DNA polymerase III subunit gamma/tau [Candidatus Auribacterota bacterium]
MSYLVLARKWRPQKFDELIGQEHIAKTLKNSIKTGRVAHAYLFAGSRGIGKTSTARIFARVLNCQKPHNQEPCGKCQSCVEVSSGSSIDIIEIDGASNNKVDDIRDIRETVQYMPAKGKFKIYIIDEVHMVTTQGFNALLKTLEEPPGHVKFFFATTAPLKVPITIRSRCQRLDFRKIPVHLIVEKLEEIVKKEKIKAEKPALILIAKFADGSMRDAQSMLDQMISFAGENIREKDVVSMLGIVDKEMIQDIVKSVIEGDAVAVLKVIEKVFDMGKDPGTFISGLIEYFRNLLLFSVLGKNMPALELSPEDEKKACGFASRLETSVLKDIISSLVDVEARIGSALSVRTFLEIAVLELIKLKDRVSIDNVINRLEKLKEKIEASPNREDNNSGERPAARQSLVSEPVTRYAKKDNSSSAEVELDGVKKIWHEAMAGISRMKPILKAYLVESRPVSFSDDVLVIGFDESFQNMHIDALRTPENVKIIERQFSMRLGCSVKVSFGFCGGQKNVKIESTEEESILSDDVTKNPHVNQVLDLFNAKITDVNLGGRG